MSELVVNAHITNLLIKKMREYLKDEKNIQSLKQFCWNKLLHKYDNDDNSKQHINSLASDLQFIRPSNTLYDSSIDNILTKMEWITNNELIKDLLYHVDSDLIPMEYINSNLKVDDELKRLSNQLTNHTEQIETIMTIMKKLNMVRPEDNKEILNNMAENIRIIKKDTCETREIAGNTATELCEIKEDVKHISNSK